MAMIMASDPGYVLVSYGGVSLEASLWVAVCGGLSFLVAVFLVALLARRLARGGGGVAAWVRGRRATTRRLQALRGTILLAEGRWREALRDLAAAADQSDAPLATWFGAARAANALGDFRQRDGLLARAAEAVPEAALVTGLTRAELQQAVGQWRESVATLNALRPRAPRHPLLLQRLFDAHRELDEPEAAAELAADLSATDLPAGAREETRRAAWRARFAKDAGDVGSARAAWRAMPKALRNDEALVLDYVDVLATNGDHERAEAVLRGALKSEWREALVLRYATIGGDVAKRRGIARKWVKSHPEDAALLLTLGRLAAAAGDAAAAESHLQASVRLATAPAPLVELARLQAASGDAQAANAYFDQAAQAAGFASDARQPQGAIGGAGA